MKFHDNILLNTDSYKTSHYLQYPPKTEIVRSYLESRGGKFSETVFFGLQYYIKAYLTGQVVTKERIDQAEQYINAHMGPGMFNRAGWEYILDNYNGHLPVVIKAVPEGTVVPVKNVLMTIENTDPQCYWLTNYLETLLLKVWAPITVATQSYHFKKNIKYFLEITGNSIEGLPFKLHDFGDRGVSSVETAAINGAAHLTQFMGTDTMEALMLLDEYYGEEMAGFSIPAAEHSTITSWGKENEVKAFENMLDKFPTGLVAVVSDSYDIINACKNLWGKDLKDKILGRDGTLVVRPDSGDPATIVVECLDALTEAFGYTETNTGHKLLPPQVRLIQGDGVSYESGEHILAAVESAGFSTDNLAFGSGGALLQKLDRDTQKFAFKCCSIQIDGKDFDVFKDPVTDPGKKSKRGQMKLIVKAVTGYETITTGDGYDLDCFEDQLVEVFSDGIIRKEYSLQEIRERCSL